MLETALTTKFIPGTNLTGEMASADWRFLLPNLQLKNVLFIGVPSVKTLTVLTSTCGESFVLSDDRMQLQNLQEECQRGNIKNVSNVYIDGSSVLPVDDLSMDLIQVAASNSSILNRRATFEELSRVLKSDGVIYYEIQGLAHRFASHNTLKKLSQRGFGILDYFWVTPFSGDLRSAVPLKNRKIASYFFANVLYGQSNRKRALSRVGGILSRLGLYSHITPRRGVVVRRPRSDEQSAEPPDYLVSLARNAGLDLSGMSYGLSARGRGNSNKIIFFLFDKSADKPVAVVKMTRAPEFNIRLENEYRVLTQLKDNEFVDKSTYPEPLFFGYHNNLAVLCLKAVRGKPFRTRTEGTPNCAVAHDAIEWIVQLGAASENKSAGSAVEVSRALGELFSRFAEIYNLSREERKFLARQIDFIGLSQKKFPVVFQHGDPGTWNMLVSDQDKVIVLDWEAGEPNGMPLWDLFYFFRTYASWVSRLQGSGDALNNFTQHFLEASPLSSRLQEITERYCKLIGLHQSLVEPLFYTCWMHRALKEATRLPAASLESGRYVNLLRLAIEHRNSPVLRRLFLA